MKPATLSALVWALLLFAVQANHDNDTNTGGVGESIDGVDPPGKDDRPCVCEDGQTREKNDTGLWICSPSGVDCVCEDESRVLKGDGICRPDFEASASITTDGEASTANTVNEVDLTFPGPVYGSDIALEGWTWGFCLALVRDDQLVAGEWPWANQDKKELLTAITNSINFREDNIFFQDTLTDLEWPLESNGGHALNTLISSTHVLLFEKSHNGTYYFDTNKFSDDPTVVCEMWVNQTLFYTWRGGNLPDGEYTPGIVIRPGEITLIDFRLVFGEAAEWIPFNAYWMGPYTGGMRTTFKNTGQLWATYPCCEDGICVVAEATAKKRTSILSALEAEFGLDIAQANLAESREFLEEWTGGEDLLNDNDSGGGDGESHQWEFVSGGIAAVVVVLAIVAVFLWQKRKRKTAEQKAIALSAHGSRQSMPVPGSMTGMTGMMSHEASLESLAASLTDLKRFGVPASLQLTSEVRPGPRGVAKVGYIPGNGKNYVLKVVEKDFVGDVEDGYKLLKHIDHENTVEPLMVCMQIDDAGSVGFLVPFHDHTIASFCGIPDNRPKGLAVLQSFLGVMVFFEQEGLVHGRICPTNILVSKVGQVLVSDPAPSPHVSKGNKQRLNLRFTAPEIAVNIQSGTAKVNEKCDIWSFGCTILASMSGQSPFQAAGDDDQVLEMMKKEESPFPQISTALRMWTLPESVVDLIERCYSYNPNRRPSFKEMADLVDIAMNNIFMGRTLNHTLSGGTVPDDVTFGGGSGSNRHLSVQRSYEAIRASLSGSDSTLREYEIFDIIGRGNQGKVYKVRRRTDGVDGVLKQTIVGVETDKVEAESKVLMELQHRNIVRFIDCFCDNILGSSQRDDPCVYIFMEYVDGGTLAERIASVGRLHEDEVIKLGKDLVSGVQCIHQHHVLHRDLKPANIFMTKEGVPKIGDFGIARQLTSTISMASTMVGTPYYIAPEICNGHQYGPKADVWSLGCILYEMLMGHKPFVGPNVMVVVQNISSGEYEPIPNTVNPELAQAIRRCLTIDVNDRISMSQLGQLRIFRAERSASASGGSYDASLSGDAPLSLNSTNASSTGSLSMIPTGISRENSLERLATKNAAREGGSPRSPPSAERFTGSKLLSRENSLEKFTPDTGGNSLNSTGTIPLVSRDNSVERFNVSGRSGEARLSLTTSILEETQSSSPGSGDDDPLNNTAVSLSSINPRIGPRRQRSSIQSNLLLENPIVEESEVDTTDATVDPLNSTVSMSSSPPMYGPNGERLSLSSSVSLGKTAIVETEEGQEGRPYTASPLNTSSTDEQKVWV